ncbi:GntR family transcriptional regulator [Pseudorhodoplanes sinuspersici]|uniref:GntR family transcriptional regulator n=1 Tax=Pseudorhodoplanes sinuspersici TaxID=1235591 RepID=A0A1W6ZKB2_9HYPH|nr:FCD domain-containing protein [Pseudorhodoplanes sinuspersici]ARP97853.1 GntR family transcriptional regulator [Pseudorhodoplanes sinuspersici]RKE68414.1 GntR family transcriptional regulator [Pseudorhodoplanes sinuspersici]
MKTSSSLTQAAYDALRAEVLTCRLAPGTKLVIADLCERLGFSLGAVREALSRLTSEGFVIAEPQRGFRVSPISEAELRDLTEVRADIESQCLRRSIEAGDIAWEGRVVAAYHELARTPERVADDPERNSEAWAQAHGRYHAALVDACDSAWLLRLRTLLYAQSERYRRLSVPLARQERDLNREHREIMEATIGRDPTRAVSLLREHLLTTTRILLSSQVVNQPATTMPEAVSSS